MGQGASLGFDNASAPKLRQKDFRSVLPRPERMTRPRQLFAAAAHRARPAGSSVSIIDRMAWPKGGAPPSVEMPMTSGERLTIAPNWKSQNAGLSTTLTGMPLERAVAAKLAPSWSSSSAPIAMATPSKSSSCNGRWISTMRSGHSAASLTHSASGLSQTSRICAPAAASSSAFQAVPADPPATRADLPLSFRNTGSVARSPMRAVVSRGGMVRIDCLAISINVGLIASAFL